MTLPPLVWSAVAAAAAFAAVYLLLTHTNLGRGFRVPLRQTLRKPVTTQYPEVKREPQPRFHGRHQLNRYEDGLEKCIGCELCAWACPADAIFVQGADNTVQARFSPGERYASDYQINYNRCIFCGLCIEACPTRALTMTHDYEMSADTRGGLLYTKERLLGPIPQGGEPTPQPDADVRERGINYYGGLAVTPPDLVGGEYAPASPRPMRIAGERLAGLTERVSTAPPSSDAATLPSEQWAVSTGRDTSHLREASGAAGAPVLDSEGQRKEPHGGGAPDTPSSTPQERSDKSPSEGLRGEDLPGGGSR